MRRSFTFPFVRLLAVAVASNTFAAERDPLADLSVEQLLDVKVTSVARREEKLSQSPAAVFVVTQEDIRRSGAASIPEALRLVPGLNVARVDAHTWAVSSRGFNDVFANKLLVLIDGRSVYTPLFSGVFWDAQDVMLEDLDRIEIIRGPGAALWGANAVNGVINIITKRAAGTQGGLVTAGGGNEERAFASFRYGGQVGEDLHYRFFGKWFDRDASAKIGGGPAHDAWQMGHLGFRLDWTPGENTFTLQGDAHRSLADASYSRFRDVSPFTAYVDDSVERVHGANVLGRWTHELHNGSQIVLQTYYDRTERDAAIVGETRETFDVDIQHRFALGERQTLVWGGGYRLTSDRVRSTFDTTLDPARRSTNLFNAFVQDEISLIPERLALTLGTKLEHNDFTGFEFQPNARLLWTPTPHQSVWASVARAARTPSRAEDDITLRQGPIVPPNALGLGSPAIVTSISGDRAFGSEELFASELGYRIEVTPRLSFDLALFHNHYHDLRTLDLNEAAPDFTASPPAFHVRVGNGLDGAAYGGELTGTWQATDWWKLRANYALLTIHTHLEPGSSDANSERLAERGSPRHQAALRSSMDLPHGFELDTTVRYADALPALRIPSYVALDLRLGWRCSETLEVSVVGQNLLDRRHSEFRPTTIGSEATEIERSIFGKVTIRF